LSGFPSHSKIEKKGDISGFFDRASDIMGAFLARGAAVLGRKPEKYF
jgi:hypothetical protein